MAGKQKGLRTVMTTLTVPLAGEWIGKSEQKGPRTPSAVQRFIADMVNGEWLETHQGIAFYTDGELSDGYMRLVAFIQANDIKPVTIRIPVTYGVKRKSGIGIDQGVVRGVRKAINDSGENGWLAAPRMVSAVREFIKFYHARKASVSEIRNTATAYQELFIKSADIARCNLDKFRCAPFQLAVFCALHRGAPALRIRELFEILNNGVLSRDSDTAAVVLRDFVFGARTGDRRKSTGRWADMTTPERVNYIQNAIQYFVGRIPVKSIQLSEVLPYSPPPLPIDMVPKSPPAKEGRKKAS